MTALPLASFITDFWNHHLVEHDRQGVFLVLVGFVGSFAFIRMSTRLQRSPRVSWWPGSVSTESGVHLHHLVFGIVTMMAAGTLGFAAFGHSPWTEICGLFFGIGAGLTIDEFALWVYLDDVYWAKEGRSSIDATVIAASLIGLVAVGVNPFESGEGEGVLATVVTALIVIGFVGFCFLKGRNLHGVIGLFLVPIAIYGACRIGKPTSPWARRRYGERHPRKQAKSEARFLPGRRTDRVKEHLRDAIGGKPSEGLSAIGDEAVQATVEASEEIRARAERVVHPKDED
jgi:hypothetical protein